MWASPSVIAWELGSLDGVAMLLKRPRTDIGHQRPLPWGYGGSETERHRQSNANDHQDRDHRHAGNPLSTQGRYQRTGRALSTLCRVGYEVFHTTVVPSPARAHDHAAESQRPRLDQCRRSVSARVTAGRNRPRGSLLDPRSQSGRQIAETAATAVLCRRVRDNPFCCRRAIQPAAGHKTR